jgi:hypothetical protein
MSNVSWPEHKPVGAAEQREAAIAVCQTHCNRSLAVLGSSYKTSTAVETPDKYKTCGSGLELVN